MANYFKTRILVLSGQLLTATGSNLFLNGLLIGSGNFDGLGTAFNTGTILYNDLVNASGQFNTNFATITNLALTGSNLYADITGLSGSNNNTFSTIVQLGNLSGFVTGLSGYDANTYSTIFNLTQTGVTIEGQINSLSGFVTGVSGYLAAHGGGGSSVEVTGSSVITTANFTGLGGTLVFTSGGFIFVSGAGAGGGSYDPLGTAANTGQILYNDIVGLSGVYTSGLGSLSGWSSGFSGVLQTEINALTTNLTNTGVTIEAQISSVSGWAGNASGALQTELNTTNTNLISTGSNLFASISSLSGFAIGQSGFSNSTYATITNLFTSGSNLYITITGFSGASNSTFATIVNLGSTGSTLLNDIFSLSGFTTGISGFIFQGLSTGTNYSSLSEIVFYSSQQGILVGNNGLLYNTGGYAIYLGTGGTGEGGGMSVGTQPAIVLNGSNALAAGGSILFRRNGLDQGTLSSNSVIWNVNSFDITLSSWSGLILGSNNSQTLYLDTGNNGIFSNNLTVSGNISGNIPPSTILFSKNGILTGDPQFYYYSTPGIALGTGLAGTSPGIVMNGGSSAYGGVLINMYRSGVLKGSIGTASVLADINGISDNIVIIAYSGLGLYSSGTANQTPTLFLDVYKNATFSNNLTISGNHTLFGNYINPSILNTGTGTAFYFGSNTGFYCWSGAGTGLNGTLPTGIRATGILPTGISGSFPSGTFSGYNFTVKNKSPSGWILMSGQFDNNFYSTTINQFIIYPLSSYTFYSDNETWNVM